MHSNLPSLGDIKDGLLKMILFSNLKNVETETEKYSTVAVLKLTTGTDFGPLLLSVKDRNLVETLKQEARHNRFKILLNNNFLGT
jgi:hypothetical protein